MPDATLRVLATCRAREDRIDEAKEVLTSIVAPSQAEAGCISYVLQQNRSDPADFAFVEEWTDEAALGVHAQTDHIRTARERFAEVLEGPVDIRLYSLVD